MGLVGVGVGVVNGVLRKFSGLRFVLFKGEVLGISLLLCRLLFVGVVGFRFRFRKLFSGLVVCGGNGEVDGGGEVVKMFIGVGVGVGVGVVGVVVCMFIDILNELICR